MMNRHLDRLRILVADVAAMDARIRAILDGDDLTFAHSQTDVDLLLKTRDFDLIVVCERFERQGFELLHAVTSSQQAHQVPVACVRLSNALTPASSPDGYKDTVLALGAKAVADLRADSPDDYDRIRRIFYGCIDRRTRMLKSNAYTRTLQLASQTLGSQERLAACLGVAAHDLMSWDSGSVFPPFAAYCSASDIVAAGPYAERHSREFPRPMATRA